MKYMLDTNICIFALKNRLPDLALQFMKHNADDICISSITYAELMYGAEKSHYSFRNRTAILLFLSAFTILPFDVAAATEYGKIRAALEKAGTPIGPMDMLIAAHAKSQQLTVVTNNTREFQRVEDLPLEDWSS